MFPTLPRAVPRRLLFAACAFALSCMATSAMAGDTCGEASDDPASDAAQRMLQAMIDTSGVPGMGAAVWRDGEVVWTGCAGWRDVDAKLPVQRDTVFRLASVSKLIAATAAATLVEEGRIDPDAAVGEALPWLPPSWSAVTVRQLVAHISGAPHYAGNDATELGRVRYPTARDAVSFFSDRALLSPPGTAYAYSSWGYTLLGAVIEAACGEHFLHYVRQHVAAGLAIGADGDDALGPASTLYEIEGGNARQVPRTDMSYTWGGGGLAATPEALVTWGGRMLSHRIVGAAQWQTMQQPTRLADGTPVRERDYEVGFGWRVGRDADGERIAHHAGTTTGARSVLMLWPEQGVAAGVLSNAQWVSSIESTAQVLAAPFRPAPENPVAASCPDAARLDGALKGERFVIQANFRIENGRCVGELLDAEPLRSFFAAAYAWPDQRLRVVSMSRDGTLSRAALATPFGLYELRAIGQGRWAATFNAGATLELSR